MIVHTSSSKREINFHGLFHKKRYHSEWGKATKVIQALRAKPARVLAFVVVESLWRCAFVCELEPRSLIRVHVITRQKVDELLALRVDADRRCADAEGFVAGLACVRSEFGENLPVVEEDLEEWARGCVGAGRWL